MKKLLILLIFSVLIFSCNNSKNKEYSALEKNQEANKHPGKKLMETNCYTCHSPSNESVAFGMISPLPSTA